MAKGKVTGLKLINKNLNKAIAKIEGDIDRGLNAGILYIKQKAIELTPVDLGFLVNSIFTDIQNGIARIGYTMIYAPYVHDMPVTTLFQKTGAENKFLSKAVERHLDEFLKRVVRFAKR